MDIHDRVLAGDRLALARLLTWIENQEDRGYAALATLYPYTGRAHLVGITGAPGTGKSTLVNRLVKTIRSPREGETAAAASVAVVAVDPSSPFSGGAILGDRIRMRDLAGDEGVFIRSMASRGALGGLSRTTAGVVQAMDAAGFERVFIETVGAGQAEVDVARTAHTTVVVTAPGMGDEVQAIKAGIMEIADILVVNKADLPGAENTIAMLRTMLAMAQTTDTGYAADGVLPADEERSAGSGDWQVPVLATISTRGDGIEDLYAAIVQHEKFLQDSGEWKSREQERIRAEMHVLLRDQLATRFLANQPDGRFDEVMQRVYAKDLSPRQAVERLLQEDAA